MNTTDEVTVDAYAIMSFTISAFGPGKENRVRVYFWDDAHKEKINIFTHLASQTYIWHSCKWNFAGPQMYLQPAKTKSKYFEVSLKYLLWN